MLNYGVKNTNLSIRFGLRIKELRKSKGLSQEDFADLCELDRTYISGIERGKRNPSLNALEILAKALNISIGELFSNL
ncbi:transcriptional regulator [Methyloradius palustris]|uniref:Transcriptional regulator n=1 Tax=Methyloradius palustris TaxID=2778876 RepID=A0A8D5K030_9PROT|nr:transcriptional regulator [Methyloradius palustris]